ncbi:lipoprotein [Streptococcus equi subsp. zooepidemicus]|uniref:Lipoprotein n=2 Tax=Streptococcus equi TaxID=1336 RepID=A0A7Z9D1F4_STRSZ|nr:lipoprotein [Streptococcus equi subsp. zooepidemicus]
MMKHQSLTSLLSLPLLIFCLSACSSHKVKKEHSKEATAITDTRKAEHQDIRAKMEKVKLATASTDFKGGTSLEELIAIFEQPTQHEEKPAGSVKLDSYTWQFDHVTVNINLYENSSIVKTIANFAFIRDLALSLKDYNSLKKGMTYDEVKQLLTEPDNYSQANSSEKETIQAIWISGLKAQTQGANIALTFENNQLTEMSQVGLED